jgi:hypothetical protein
MLVTLNKAAELLETDRGVMGRAARDVRSVAGDDKRPLFRLSDLAAALERHRAAPDRRTTAVKNALPAELEEMFADHEQLDSAVRNAPNIVEARRRLCPLLSHLVELIREMRRDSEAAHEPNGEFRIMCFEFTALATLREVVGKSFDDLHSQYCAIADERFGADEAA